MGLCGCAEKHDAAEELRGFHTGGESDVGKNSKIQNRVKKDLRGGTDARRRTAGETLCSCMWAVNAPGVYELRDRDARIYEALEAGRWE